LSSSGGGESFLKFLEDELISHIEAKYRTQPYRLLVGHSFGGLFAVNAFVRRSPIFQGFIAIDPSLWWDDEVLLRRAKEIAGDLKGSLYISLANDPPDEGDADPQLWKRTTQDFAEFLKVNNSPAFRSALQYFEAENHGSVPLLSLYHGLLFLFDGYKPSGFETGDDRQPFCHGIAATGISGLAARALR
jgi:predicted alpha/beta superfamily hydrolase